MASAKDPSLSILLAIKGSQELQSVAYLPGVIAPLDATTTLQKPLSFTQSQLALAVTIQRSKQAGLSTRGALELKDGLPCLNLADYCLELVKNIKLGAFPGPREGRHVDSAEFWKDQYNQLHSQKTRLEIEACRLEHEVEHLRNSNEGVGSLATDLSVTESNKSCKRKAPHNLQIPIDELQSSHALGQLVSSGPITYLPLLVHAQVLDRLLQDNEASPDTLLASLKSAIAYMTEVLADISKKCNRPGQTDRKSCAHIARQALTVITAVFNVCLQSLGHLCRDIVGRRHKGQVIYALVKFFARVLESVQSLCISPEEPDHVFVRTTRLRIRVRKETKGKLNVERSPLLLQYTLLVKNILLCPELLTTHSVPVLEGILSVLLSRIGNLMSESVFGAQISSSKLPGGIANAEEPKCSAEHEMAIQLEGKHLAWALEQAISNRDVKERNALLALLAGQNTSIGTAGNEALLTKARQRLQDTLLAGIFGVDGEKFLTALKLPEDSGDEWRAESTTIEPAVIPSFVQSIWSTVGWQILEKLEE